MNYKIKLIGGFRRDQECSIDAEEAHKAYYLFLHPESRGIFSNGLAIIGSQIQRIEPDYQGTMGWNEAHFLDADDQNELRAKGVDRKLQQLMAAGKEVAQLAAPQDLNVPLTELLETKYPRLKENKAAQISGAKSIGEILK